MVKIEIPMMLQVMLPLLAAFLYFALITSYIVLNNLSDVKGFGKKACI